jgi:hypothetical protein
VEHRDTRALYHHLSREGDLIAKFLYAIVITVIVVLVTIRLGWLAEQAKERERGLLDRLRE